MFVSQAGPYAMSLPVQLLGVQYDRSSRKTHMTAPYRDVDQSIDHFIVDG